MVVTRVVRPGKEPAFARWAQDVDDAAASFEGYIAGVRLHDDHGLNHLVYQFDSEENLRRWEESDVRADLRRRGDRLSEERRSTAGGADTWFTVPGQTAQPKWKTFLLTWAAVYPILLVISTVVSLAAPWLPEPAALAVSSATLTALLTWVILPRINRRFRPWLLRGARPEPSRRPQDW